MPPPRSGFFSHRRAQGRAYRRRSAAASKIQAAFRRRKRSQAKRITTLEKKVADNRQWAQYELNSGNTTLTNGAWSVISLVNPAQWIPRFQSTDKVSQNSKVNLYSVQIQLYHRPTDSLLPLTAKMITVYLVKLRRETALQVLEDSGQMTTAGFNQTDNKNYLWDTQNIGLSYEALPSLNQGMFKILAKKEFQVQNIIQNTAATSVTVETSPDVAVTDPPFTFRKINMYKKVSNLIKSGRGDKHWKELAEDELDSMDRYYLLTHVGGNGNTDTLEDGNTVDQGIHVRWTVRSTQ